MNSNSALNTRLSSVLVPMIRRTFPELITNDIVGIQPMLKPMCIDKGTLQYNVLKDLLGVSPKLYNHPCLEGIFLDDDSWELNSVFPKSEYNFERLTFGFNCKITPKILSYAVISPYYKGRHDRKIGTDEIKRASAQGFLLFKLPS